MDTILSLLDSMLQYTVPILIAAIGGFYSEKSGVVNIALDGFVIFGAFIASFFATTIYVGEPSIPALVICILIAAISGSLMSLVHAYVSINLKADQVISGTAINLITPAVALFLVNHYNGTYELLLKTGFPRYSVIGKLTVYPTIIIAILLVILTYYVIYKRPFGLRLRSIGENPQAADSLGLSVYKYRYIGVLISGALAGLSGGIIATTFSQGFNAAITVYGFGYLSLAALIFGKYNPITVTFAALFFGGTKVFAEKVSILAPSLPVPISFWNMFPFIATIVALIVFSKKSAAPDALGIPYDKGQR
ncbi:ABC transporter permease [Gemelliphila asaccharolytica]|uniref:Branched-chain amino acid ABC transporter, permease protein n=1 Tax=Gemelliphila asaccharolytica TaxID=502393 RepID=A0ABR5TNA6_9BACL|nr:ABC transporter permease [Gemella asaccharolytica]KXB58881.1 branched-chain amino acid ABC transporter, permease protein [Gemella asaccharolytica]